MREVALIALDQPSDPGRHSVPRRLVALIEYCRGGQHLLTLATPPGAVAFRTWYLTEFADQLDGKPPTPWPVFAQRYGIG